MNRLKSRFTFENKSEDESSSTKSLFKLAPCTFIIAFILGMPLSTATTFRHLSLFLANLLLRIWLSYSELSTLNMTFQPFARVNHYLAAYVTSYLFFKNSRKIVTFISSGQSLAPKLRKIDILCLLLYSVVVTLFYCVALNIEFRGPKSALSFLDGSPAFKRIVLSILTFYQITWLQLAPLCAVVYALGFCVLFEFKVNTLASLLHDFHPVNYRPLLTKVKSVSDRQQQFESVFSCFLFVSLFYNFLSTIYFLYNLTLLVSHSNKYSYYLIIYNLFQQAICIGLIFFVSFHDERLKESTNRVCGRIELQMGENLPANSCLITFLRKKIYKTINEPLTACKMVTVDRQIVLATAASCVSFAVLLIQINNGALA